MKLTQIAVDNPVFATMMMVALLVMGLFSYRQLGIDQFPNVDFPIVVVTTEYPGASPETVETEISRKIGLVHQRSHLPEQDEVEQRVLAFGVLVQQPGRDPGEGRDVGHAGALEADLLEHGDGGVEDLVHSSGGPGTNHAQIINE